MSIVTTVMAISIIWHRILTFSAVCGVLLLAGSCVYDRLGTCPEGSAEDVCVTFRIATQNTVGTKADNIAGQETGTAAENWLELDRLRFLMFTEGGAFLQDLSAIAETMSENTDIWNLYTVKATFKEPYFNNPLFVDGNVRFKLMVLANWPAEAVEEIMAAKGSVSEIERAHAVFEMSPEFFPDTGKTGIPMFGLMDCAVSWSALAASDTGNYVDIGDVYMLRSLAKIEVLDNIADKDAAGYPKVSEVRLMKWNSVARMIPDNFRNGVQVSAASYPDAPGFVDSAQGRMFKWKEYSTESLGAPYEFKGFTTYIPEIRTERLAFRVVIQQSAAEGDAVSHDLAVPGTGNAWGTEILRNHIYRINVNATAEISLDYTVCPWDEANRITIPPYPEN